MTSLFATFIVSLQQVVGLSKQKMFCPRKRERCLRCSTPSNKTWNYTKVEMAGEETSQTLFILEFPFHLWEAHLKLVLLMVGLMAVMMAVMMVLMAVVIVLMVLFNYKRFTSNLYFWLPRLVRCFCQKLSGLIMCAVWIALPKWSCSTWKNDEDESLFQVE